MVMDSQPVTANALGRYFHIKGSEIERYYKHHLSDFTSWDQRAHATDWVLQASNIGERCSIDETQLCEEVYTIVSNKDGKGRKGTIIAIIKGTKVSVVSRIIKKIPAAELAKVKEITMDFSDSMYGIAKECFPNAEIVIDCFHIVQRLCEGLEEMRLRFKRLAVTQAKKAACEFKKREDRKAKNRAYYRKTHKRNIKEKRGRKRIGRQKYKAPVLPNGDTRVELLTRCRNLLSQSGEKWGEHRRERANLLFELYPQMKEGYSLICRGRNIFKKKISREDAGKELHDWYKEVNACTLREIKAARDCVKSKENEVLNYFKNRSTNASAESLNSKIKGFRAQLHGVADIPFFMYRLRKIFG
jgi:transposase